MAGKTPTFTHQDWDIIGTALGYRIAQIHIRIDRGEKRAARMLAQAEATARKVDAMFLETYPEAPATPLEVPGGAD